MRMRTDGDEEGEEIDGFVLITTRGGQALVSTSFGPDETAEILLGAAESIGDGGGFNQVEVPTIQ